MIFDDQKIEKPQKGRAKIKNIPGALQIEIPNRKMIFLIIFLPIWLTGYIIIGGKAIMSMLSERGGIGIVFLFIFLWCGLFAFLIWSWNVFGKEIITLNSSKLIIRRAVYNIGIKKAYSMVDTRKFRVNPVPENKSIFGNPYDPFGLNFNGKIAFDYGMKTIKFAGGIEEAEASYILELCKKNGYLKE